MHINFQNVFNFVVQSYSLPSSLLQGITHYKFNVNKLPAILAEWYFVRVWKYKDVILLCTDLNVRCHFTSLLPAKRL